MLDLIYIVEEQTISDNAQNSDTEYSVNFTMPGRSENLTNVAGGASAVGVAAIAASAKFLALPFLPTPLIASALFSAPSLISLFSKDNDVKNGEPDTAKLEEARLLASYVHNHSLSRSQAKAKGYHFQPGHPTYRKHPLTDYPNPDNGNLYIPSDSYDAILLEERESELIKLLVHLGATKITITKKASDNTRSGVTASLSAQAGSMGGGDIKYTESNERYKDSLDTREFLLSGRPWKTDSTVERKNFFWLSYEPSWKAVVFARENGGCLTASLEIKESTSFSSDKNLELSVKAQLTEIGAQAGISNVISEEKTYFVRAEFAPVQNNN